MDEGERGGRGPEGEDPFSPSPSTFPSGLTPPLYSASRGVRGGREGVGRGGGWEKPRNAHLLRTTPEPPPPLLPPAAAAAAAKSLPVALHEGGAERVSPSPRRPPAPPRLPAASPELSQCRSNLRSRPRRPGSGLLPPRTRGPLQTPWARGGCCCSVRKHWPRLGPARRGSGGGAPGTVSPATGRGRARRDAGSSRSTAGARRRRWQREPRDRSITGSHGARAFSSLRAGASARHTSSGRKGPAPEPPRRAAGRALRSAGGGASRFVLVLRSRLVLSPPLLPRPGREGAAGGGDSSLGGVGGQTGLVQRLQPTPFKGTRAAASRVSVPRSPPSPRHESGVPPRRAAGPSSPPRRTWARPPSR
ncbi:unnamed protein product, partial [Rangifer tarandus platyrhynchus]